MTKRVNQLLLEVLLLREKYSQREVSEARRLILSNSSNQVLQELSVLLSTEHPGKDAIINRRKRYNNTDVTAVKKSFLASLRRPGSINSRRYQQIADRLGINWQEGKQEQFVKIVSSQLDAMSEDELQDFLRNRRDTSEPDLDYLNLANYLVDKGEAG